MSILNRLKCEGTLFASLQEWGYHKVQSRDLDEDHSFNKNGHIQSLIGRIQDHYYEPNLLFYSNGIKVACLWPACVWNDRRHQGHPQIEICQHHFLYSW